MSSKMIAAMAAIALLATSGFASAQTKPDPKVGNSSGHNYSKSYYDRAYWDAVTPQGGADRQRDPYAGTIWKGVAPY
jgi:hypothetical protein